MRLGVVAAGFALLAVLAAGCGKDSGGGTSTAPVVHGCNILPTAGDVLVTGGFTNFAGTQSTASAELYDPTTKAFIQACNMTTARAEQQAIGFVPGAVGAIATATFEVIIAGGENNGSHLQSAEIYNFDTGRFTKVKPGLSAGREDFTAVLDTTGTILFAGGDTSAEEPGDTADVFSISTLKFSTTGNLTIARSGYGASLIGGASGIAGDILLTGGYTSTTLPVLQTAELYSPTAGTFTATTGNLVSQRQFHSQVTLPDGTVLLAGGDNGSATLATAEIFTPSTQTFAATTGNMTDSREAMTMTLLNDGTVLLTGGIDDSGTILDTAEIYHPSTGLFTATTGNMTTPREDHTATLLSDGTVLITGGYGTSAALNTAEIYDPTTGLFTATTGAMVFPRAHQQATLLE
ncbi:MAG: hypothetical protein IVW56_08730 [Candidatus Binataceae bacterium]|nr:hypothetical protein [Candidatus Binataceae bacterium]